MDSMVGFLIIILLFVGGNILLINFGKQKNRRSAEQNGWTILKISYDFFSCHCKNRRVIPPIL
jgi:hypothetical protein